MSSPLRRSRRLVFTAYNRPHYFEPVMDSWTLVRGYPDWDPTVFLEPSSMATIMRGIAHDHQARVHLNPTRRGVLSNPWHALDTAFGTAEFAVLAEDDVLVSDDILDMFAWAADEYRAERVLAVCANTQARTCPPDKEQTLELHQRFCPLVWGTWTDRWERILRPTWDHDYSTGTTDAPQSGWDWNINLRIMADWRIAAPLSSRSTHIGQYGGSHMHPMDFPNSISPTYTPHRDPAPYRRQPIATP